MSKFSDLTEGVIDPSLRHKDADITKTYLHLETEIEKNMESVRKKLQNIAKNFHTYEIDEQKDVIKKLAKIASQLDVAARS